MKNKLTWKIFNNFVPDTNFVYYLINYFTVYQGKVHQPILFQVLLTLSDFETVFLIQSNKKKKRIDFSTFTLCFCLLFSKKNQHKKFQAKIKIIKFLQMKFKKKSFSFLK